MLYLIKKYSILTEFHSAICHVHFKYPWRTLLIYPICLQLVNKAAFTGCRQINKEPFYSAITANSAPEAKSSPRCEFNAVKRI